MSVPHLPVKRDTLLHQRACCDNVTLTQGEPPRETVGSGDALLEAHFPRKCETFLEQRPYSCLISLRIKEHLCQLREGMSNALLVFHLSKERQVLLEQLLCPGVLTLAADQQRQGEECVSSELLVVYFSEERQSLL